MTVVTLPDGARAKAHLHRTVETAVYVFEGEADMPHLVLNRSGAPCRALVAHSAEDDQAGIELLPHLDPLV
jgi:uncharacterized RmlC-like cupin family protein